MAFQSSPIRNFPDSLSFDVTVPVLVTLAVKLIRPRISGLN